MPLYATDHTTRQTRGWSHTRGDYCDLATSICALWVIFGSLLE
jgi:hypothetical protein